MTTIQDRKAISFSILPRSFLNRQRFSPLSQSPQRHQTPPCGLLSSLPTFLLGPNHQGGCLGDFTDVASISAPSQSLHIPSDEQSFHSVKGEGRGNHREDPALSSGSRARSIRVEKRLRYLSRSGDNSERPEGGLRQAPLQRIVSGRGLARRYQKPLHRAGRWCLWADLPTKDWGWGPQSLVSRRHIQMLAQY